MSVVEQARRARDAAEALATATRTVKDAALHAMADALVARTPEVLAANAADLAAGREAGLSAAVLDRLALDEGRVAAIADALRQMAALPDPVGEVVRGSTLPNGLELRQVRVHHDQVDPERRIGQGLDRLDLLVQPLRGHRPAGQDPEGAGPAQRGHQVALAHPGHGAAEERQFTAQEPASPGGGGCQQRMGREHGHGYPASRP